MKKLIYVMLLPALLTGCFHDDDPVGDTTVEGNIRNDAIVLHNYLPALFKEAFAVDTISTRSTLIVTDPERLNDVSVATGIQIDADVINSTSSKIEGYKVDIFIEDEQQLTKEQWDCQVCYPVTNGTDCQSLGNIKGNTIFESEPEPVLPICDSNFGQQDLCVTIFPDGIDCLSPTYTWEYTEAGDGLQKYMIDGISVNALSNFVSSVGTQSGGWPTGTNKYARFILYNNVSVEVLHKDYVFNVLN